MRESHSLQSDGKACVALLSLLNKLIMCHPQHIPVLILGQDSSYISAYRLIKYDFHYVIII